MKIQNRRIRPLANASEGIAYLNARGVEYDLDDTGQFIEQVSLEDAAIVDELLLRLQQLKQIKKFYLGELVATADRFRTMVDLFPQVVHLVIEDSGRVPIEVYADLYKLEQLRSFCRSVPRIIDEQHCDISHYPADPNTAAKLDGVFRLVKLDWLNLDQLNIDDIDFTPIEQFTDLKTLALADAALVSENEFTSEQLRHIGRASKLAWLNLAHTKIADEGLKELENLQQLTYLSLCGNSGITSDCASTLLKLRSLEELDLNDTEIGSETLKVMSAHPMLKKLSVGGTWITDYGLVSLAKLKTLKSLNVEVTKVTQEGVEQLRRALPNCQIETNPREYMGADRTKL